MANHGAEEPIRLRDAVETDLRQLCELAIRSKAYWGYEQAFMDACREELHVPSRALGEEVVRLAEAKEGPAGFYRLSIQDEEPEVGAFFVEPGWIGRGIGRRMWEDLRRSAIRAGVHRIICQSDPNAEPFYRRMGLRRVGMKPSLSIAGRELPLMELVIAN